MNICSLVQAEYEYIKNVRRKLHSMAELSGAEVKTAAYIKEQLQRLGFRPKDCAGGILCDISSKTDKHNFIGLRADMDALPIKEKRNTGFNAQGDVMHACGHDGHMAMLLGVASLAAKVKPDYNLRLIFQPAEEKGGGAATMIAAGAAKGLTEAYALHLCPSYPVGTIAVDSGSMFAGVVEFDIRFLGKSSHCAHKQMGIDALAAANAFFSSFYQLADKYNKNNLLHIGKINGGSARNIVADSCKLECTMRFFDPDQSEAMTMEIAQILSKIEKDYNIQTFFETVAVYPPLVNSPHCVAVIRQLVDDAVVCEPQYTAEDFSEFCLCTEAAISWLGTKQEGFEAPLHSDMFGFDEKALLYGLEFYKRIIYAD